jgi:hypothetical protein
MVSDPCFWNVWMVTALRPRAQVDDEDPTGNQTDTCKREQLMSEVRLGIDVACRADHRASLADDRGEFLWSSWRFRTTTVDLERLWAKIPDGTRVPVILEPTRNCQRSSISLAIDQDVQVIPYPCVHVIPYP